MKRSQSVLISVESVGGCLPRLNELLSECHDLTRRLRGGMKTKLNCEKGNLKCVFKMFDEADNPELHTGSLKDRQRLYFVICECLLFLFYAVPSSCMSLASAACDNIDVA